jgi:predicted MFS family arabinose efflux permease
LPVVIHGLTLAVFVNRMGGAAKAFFALYLHETRGLELTTVGLLLSLYGAGAIAGSFLMGILSDRWPARRLVVATMAVSGLSLLALALAESVWLMASLLFVGCLMDGGFRPLTQRLIMEAAHEHVRVRAQSTVRAALNLGVGAAGLISGWLVARGYLWVFMADGAASLVSAALLWWQLRG